MACIRAATLADPGSYIPARKLPTDPHTPRHPLSRAQFPSARLVPIMI